MSGALPLKRCVALAAICAAMVLSSAGSANAFFGLLCGHKNCGEPSCCCEQTCACEPSCGCEQTCACEPSCGCNSCCHRRCCLLDGLCGMFRCHKSCCEPSCCCEQTCACEPSCCAEQTCACEPSCGCNTCCPH